MASLFEEKRRRKKGTERTRVQHCVSSWLLGEEGEYRKSRPVLLVAVRMGTVRLTWLSRSKGSEARKKIRMRMAGKNEKGAQQTVKHGGVHA